MYIHYKSYSRQQVLMLCGKSQHVSFMLSGVAKQDLLQPNLNYAVASYIDALLIFLYTQHLLYNNYRSLYIIMLQVAVRRHTAAAAPIYSQCRLVAFIDYNVVIQVSHLYNIFMILLTFSSGGIIYTRTQHHTKRQVVLHNYIA